jgi:ferredoxin
MTSIRLNEHPAVPAEPGGDLLGSMLARNLPAMYLCMSGSCRRCKVRVVSGGENLDPRHRAEDAHRLGPDERLACQALVVGDGEIVVKQG